MPGSAPKKGIVRLARTGGMLAGAWALVGAMSNRVAYVVHDWLQDAIYRVFAGFPATVVLVERLFDKVWNASNMGYLTALAVATMAIPLGFAFRLIARARVRAGHRDPIDRLRAWTGTHPKATTALLAAPAVLWAFFVDRAMTWGPNDHPLVPALVAAAFGAGEWWLLRAGLRLFLEPTMDEGATSTMTVSDDEIVFDAVAVTRETIGAIALMALLPVAFVAWAATVKLTRLYSDKHVFELIAGYVAVAIGGAALFKRASRTAIGIDGVRVYGTSRTRFYAYRDLELARFTGGDLELVSHGRALIRLQLHGEDAARRDAILARITERIAASRDPRAHGAQRLVEGKTTEEAARVTMGGGGYRAPSVTREELWRLVEGPTTDAKARAAAAEVLAHTSAPAERARLRVAAEKCADVRVRVTLEAIAETIPREEETVARTEARVVAARR